MIVFLFGGILKIIVTEGDINLNTIDFWNKRETTKKDIYAVFSHKKRNIVRKVYSLFKNRSYQNSKIDNFKKKIF